MLEREALASAMQDWGFLEDPVPAAAWHWIDTFIEAYPQSTLETARPLVAALRAEACVIPALELERLLTANPNETAAHA